MPAPFDITSLTGITEQEAAARLKREGFNELPSSKQRSIFAIAFDVVREPMFLLLVACGVIYLFLGLSLSVPFFRELFRFSVLHTTDILICVAAGVVSVLWFEVLKITNRSRPVVVK